MPRTTFDAAYYRRFYRGKGRVHGARDVAHLARAVCELAAWYRLPLDSALDVGAGTGLWRDWFRRHRPGVRYRSTDVAPHACERYGHERRDIAAWRSRARYDLVVCHGVLHYLSAPAAARAIENLGAMTRGLLYLEVVTAEDLDVVDPAGTDMDFHIRPARWYRTRLARHFLQLGAGLWIARRSGLVPYALEGGR